jgi:hypothetical protein
MEGRFAGLLAEAQFWLHFKGVYVGNERGSKEP